jgi:hypothetical protein
MSHGFTAENSPGFLVCAGGLGFSDQRQFYSRVWSREEVRTRGRLAENIDGQGFCTVQRIQTSFRLFALQLVVEGVSSSTVSESEPILCFDIHV